MWLMLRFAAVCFFAVTGYSQQCYWGPNEVADPSYVPCSPQGEGIAACCMLGDFCLNYGACFNSANGVTYVAGCTDQTYGDGQCQGASCGKHSQYQGLAYCYQSSWVCCSEAVGLKPTVPATDISCPCVTGLGVAFLAPSSLGAAVASLPSVSGDPTAIFNNGQTSFYTPPHITSVHPTTSTPIATPTTSMPKSTPQATTTTLPSSNSQAARSTTQSTSQTASNRQSSTEPSPTGLNSGAASTTATGTGAAISAMISATAAVSPQSSNNGLKIGLGVGITLGLILLIVIIALAILCRRRRRYPSRDPNEDLSTAVYVGDRTDPSQYRDEPAQPPMAAVQNQKSTHGPSNSTQMSPPPSYSHFASNEPFLPPITHNEPIHRNF